MMVNEVSRKAAMRMATDILRAVKNCIHPAERQEARAIFYEICCRGIEDYHGLKTKRMLDPSRN